MATLQVSQISGISRQYHQDFFKAMKSEIGIDLENIVYYRGETHYFVMTALRTSLIEKGVILADKEDRKELMAPSNVDRSKLHSFAIEAAQYATGHFSAKLPVTEFALDARGNPDCAVFDFTNLYSAKNACQVRVTSTTCFTCGEKEAIVLYYVELGEFLLSKIFEQNLCSC